MRLPKSLRDHTDRRDVVRAGLAAAAGAVVAPAVLAPRAARADEAHSTLPIGMNLARVADWEPGYPFRNLLWGSRRWMTRNSVGRGPWDTGFATEIALDADGYPLAAPFTPLAHTSHGDDLGHLAQDIFTLLPNTRPEEYVVRFDGDGELGAWGAAKIVAAEPGRAMLSILDVGAVAMLMIRRSRRGNPVRNIRVLPLADAETDPGAMPFRRALIDYCRPWHCLRYMDWLGTNGSIDITWGARKRPGFYTQVGESGDVLGLFGPPMPLWQRQWASGVALEHCITLSNATRTHAWLNVPHLADDNYMREMAMLVRDRLDPALKVYVEYSNELWNWSFLQAQWMLRSELAGDLVVLGGGAPPWKGGVKPARFINGVVAEGAGEGSDHPERIGALFSRCFAIFEDVFRGADRARLVRVCAVQAAWTDAAQRTLNWVMRHGGCDVLAPSGYFGPDEAIYARWAKAGSALTADEVIADMRQVIANDTTIASMGALARRAGVGLVIYEGGQHIQPENQKELAYNPALAAAQKHPAMYGLYRTLLDKEVAAGASLFCAYDSIGRQGERTGSWGHLEHYGQPAGEMPKFRALLDADSPRCGR